MTPAAQRHLNTIAKAKEALQRLQNRCQHKSTIRTPERIDGDGMDCRFVAWFKCLDCGRTWVEDQ